MATFLWDLISALVPVVITMVIFAAFQTTGYTGENIAAVGLLLVRGVVIYQYHWRVLI